MNRVLAIFSAALFGALLGGCATAAKPQAMVVQPQVSAVVNPKLAGAIKVGAVTGGKSTNPLWTSQVDDAGFGSALERSLAIAGYLAPSGGTPVYTLSAELGKLQQPLFGLSFDVTSTLTYHLEGNGTKTDYPVTAIGTAKVADAWVGVERLRIANERAISENIKALLERLQTY